jgi:hypothetical protein
MKGKAEFQQTLASQSNFEKYGRKSRREEFLNLMESVVPWRELESVIEPYYPKAGNGRQPVADDHCVEAEEEEVLRETAWEQ